MSEQTSTPSPLRHFPCRLRHKGGECLVLLATMATTTWGERVLDLITGEIGAGKGVYTTQLAAPSRDAVYQHLVQTVGVGTFDADNLLNWAADMEMYFKERMAQAVTV